MAAPITHIVLSEKVLKNFFPRTEKKKFFIGTSLPDIRYLGVVDRNATHFNKVKFPLIKDMDSFNKGLIFHSIIDSVREELLLSKDLYSIMPKSKYITQSIKLLEDQVLYNKIKNWSGICNYFKEILTEERNLGIDKESIRLWHNLLIDYYTSQPDENSLKAFVRGIRLESTIAEEIIDNIRQINDNKYVLSYIHLLYNSIEERIADLAIF